MLTRVCVPSRYKDTLHLNWAGVVNRLKLVSFCRCINRRVNWLNAVVEPSGGRWTRGVGAQEVLGGESGV